MVTFDVPSDRDAERVLGAVSQHLETQLTREFRAAFGGGIRRKIRIKAMYEVSGSCEGQPRALSVISFFHPLPWPTRILILKITTTITLDIRSLNTTMPANLLRIRLTTMEPRLRHPAAAGLQSNTTILRRTHQT
jgi:hypothetical protein